MISVLVTIPEGLGDAIQTLPALKSLSVSSADLTVVIKKPYQDLFRYRFSVNAKFYDWETIVTRGKVANHFDVVLDLRGLSNVGDLFQVLSWKHLIRHTLFIDPKVKQGAPCIYVDDSVMERKFFNADGIIPSEAWTFYAFMLQCVYGSIKSSLPPIHTMDVVAKKISQNLRDLELGVFQNAVAFLPGGTLKSKKWPLESHMRLADYFLERGFVCNFYLGPNERGDMDILQKRSPAIVIYQELDLLKLSSKLLKSRLVIANDCGPMHVAAVIGCPIVAIFRSTLPQCWFPYRGSDQKYVGGPRFSGPFFSRLHSTDNIPSEHCVLQAARSLLHL